MENNIHTFPGKAKGKRPPSKKLSVPFEKFLITLPTVPLVDLAPNYYYPMDGNDLAGDCVVAAWDHFRQVVTGLLGGEPKNFTQDEIWNFYKTQNPHFDPHGTASTHGPGSNDDGGMNVQDFLSYLVSQKLILGFAKVDPRNADQLKAAIYIGLGTMLGVVVDEAQMGQQYNDGVWDYVPNSKEDGGHCVPLVGYLNTPVESTCVTWGKLVQCTPNFLTHQADEAWFVLMQEHVDHPQFRNFFDLRGFSDAVKEITMGKVVIPVPATPPQPAPVLGAIIQKPTPNFTQGRGIYKPEAIVLHIMAGTLIGTDSWFANPASQVSAHYGIGTSGEIHQYVQEADEAWHAGAVNHPTWFLLKANVNPNLYTIGIEHEGQSDTIWSEAMKTSSAQMVFDISKRWNIPLDRQHVIGHYELDSVNRINCPAIDKSIVDDILARAIVISGGVDNSATKAQIKGLLDQAKGLVDTL